MDNKKIREIALKNGFKLKEQADGAMDLNPYVYQFTQALIYEAFALNHVDKFLLDVMKHTGISECCGGVNEPDDQIEGVSHTAGQFIRAILKRDTEVARSAILTALRAYADPSITENDMIYFSDSYCQQMIAQAGKSSELLSK